MAWIFAVVAGLWGALGDRELSHFVLFSILGWLFGRHFQRPKRSEILARLEALERDSVRLRSALGVSAPEAAGYAPAQAPSTPPPAPPQSIVPDRPEIVGASPVAPPATPSARPPEGLRTPPPLPRPTAPIPKPLPPPPPNPVIEAVVRFFTTGNVFAKVGAILLIFGVAFLIKFVSDMGLFPIEGRLIGTALASNVLIALGWRLRKKREGYAWILRGVGFGILYLTVFGAYRQWELLPAAFAFGLLVAATLLFSLLAVLQNALPLASLAVSGGFLAPVLVGSGSGNFIGLFSYYTVLNVGVLLVTWLRAWRELHLIGFLFIYAVGWLWGREYFTPAHFVAVEPFLLFHFFLYVAVALRFARLQRGATRAFAVDGMLVFGVPMTTFALQAAMLKDTRFGVALTAAALGVFYLALARTLFRRKNPEARALVESFLASGLIFTTLAVPFALSPTWTSAVWALEGAFLVWYGTRQRRTTIRAFGYLLQGLGYVAYVGKASLFVPATDEFGALLTTMPTFNAGFLGALTLFGAAVFTSYQLAKKRDAVGTTE